MNPSVRVLIARSARWRAKPPPLNGPALSRILADTGQQRARTSQKAGQNGRQRPVQASRSMWNAAKPGPGGIITSLPGEIKSNNANFMQKFGPSNIAPISPSWNFPRPTSRCWSAPTWVPLLQEFQLAYNLGDPQAAAQALTEGSKLKTTKWVIKFDIVKAEQV
ncbi:MAG: hypothetical protein IPG33_17455, partial [Betaproteobacteria bacterium]|nr:hypothetical protein [Betaproteobacteria bacterium]